MTIAAALSFAVVPSVAFAQNQNLAEQLFSEGLAAMKAERWAAACDAFAASDKADPSPGTEINLGVCHEKQKKYASALTWFDAAARLASDPDKPRPDRAKLARSEYERVLPMAHSLHVVVKKPVEGASLSRNGEKVPLTVYTTKDTFLDPGKYTFELTAKGKKPVVKEITIPEAPGKSTLELPEMEDAPPEAVADGGAGGAGDTGKTPVVVNDGSGQRTVAIVVAGAGVLALLVAGGVQILANSEQGKSEDNAAKASDETITATDRANFSDSAREHHSAAENDELIAQVTAAGGGVLLVVGAVLYFTAPKAHASASTKVLPVVGPGYAGGSFGFTF